MTEPRSKDSNMQQEFLKSDRKAVTLMGMSGVGKTYLSCKLSDWGWAHHSCDYYIGAHVLADQLDAPVTTEDLSALSRFVGQVGDPAHGGLALDEFKARQKSYYNAECKAVAEMSDFASHCEGHIINDSTGSLCEITDEALIADVCSSSLLVYIKATPKEEQAVLQRAQDYPKPLFFPESLFDEKLATYMREEGIDTPDVIVPNDFARWVFPHLFEARLPKYQALADRYGVTIASSKFHNIDSESAFIEIVSAACEDQIAGKNTESKHYG